MDALKMQSQPEPGVGTHLPFHRQPVYQTNSVVCASLMYHTVVAYRICYTMRRRVMNATFKKSSSTCTCEYASTLECSVRFIEVYYNRSHSKSYLSPPYTIYKNPTIINSTLPPSPSAMPGAASPAAPARPTRRPCTAPTSSGPAPSTARPSPGCSPRPSTRPTRPGSPTPAGSGAWPPNWSPVPGRNGPGRRLGQDHPRHPGAAPHQPRPGPEPELPNHPKRREISPLNPGTALRRTSVTAGHRVLSLAHKGLPTELPVSYRQNCIGDRF